jgi:hypothetical protein
MTDNITLPRDVGEEMRDALTCGKSGRHWCPHCDDSVDNFRDVLDAALAQPDAKREPATREQVAEAYKANYDNGWFSLIFFDAWRDAERFHGIRGSK